MKVLIATGGSEYSFMAVEKACRMVIRPGLTEVRIISVYQDLAGMTAEPLEISSEQIEEIENIGRLRSTGYILHAEELIRAHFPGEAPEISTRCVRGSPREMILKEAERWGADLIVVGSLGHNFLSRMLLGSVSEAVVRHAPCSVMVVRGQPEKTEQ